jgi:hypothetical protein
MSDEGALFAERQTIPDAKRWQYVWLGMCVTALGLLVLAATELLSLVPFWLGSFGGGGLLGTGLVFALYNQMNSDRTSITAGLSLGGVQLIVGGIAYVPGLIVAGFVVAGISLAFGLYAVVVTTPDHTVTISVTPDRVTVEHLPGKRTITLTPDSIEQDYDSRLPVDRLPFVADGGAVDHYTFEHRKRAQYLGDVGAVLDGRKQLLFADVSGQFRMETKGITDVVLIAAHPPDEADPTTMLVTTTRPDVLTTALETALA